MGQHGILESTHVEATEAQVRLILNAIQTGIIILDKQSQKVVEANAQACQMMGIPSSLVQGQHCYNVVCPCPKSHTAPYPDVPPDTSKRILITADGQEIPVIESITEIKYQNRECLVCTVVDISEQIAAQKQAMQTSKEWRSTFDSITDMLSIHDRNCQIVRVNKALADAFETTPQALIGKKCHEVFHGTHDVLPTCPAHQTFADDRNAQTEFYEPSLDRYLDVSTSPIKDDQGEIVGAVHIAKDVTEAKKARDELIHMNEKLKELDQLKNEFVSITSHELRTPLSVILGALRLLNNEIPGPMVDTQQQVVQTAMDNVQRLARIVDDLLDVSKIEAGKLQLQLAPTLLGPLVQECTGMYAQVAEERKIHLDSKISDGLPEITIDPDRIRQVIDNLVSNSLKFTPEQGHVTVHCRHQEKEILITIEDTGRGIALEDIPRLFDKFTQFGKRETGPKKGTGLGLAICKGLVEQHGGRIWVDSKMGQGSCFNFSLPITPVAGKINQEED